MKLEDGKYYRAEDGSKIGPIYSFSGDLFAIQGQCDSETPGWNSSGQPHDEYPKPHGALIAEWPDTDLTAITTPFGLLDEATQDALEAHDGEIEYYGSQGWVIKKPLWNRNLTYRARKKPVEDSVTHKACAFQIGSHEPIVSASQYGADWVQGEITTHRVDGKPVRIVWEATQ